MILLCLVFINECVVAEIGVSCLPLFPLSVLCMSSISMRSLICRSVSVIGSSSGRSRLSMCLVPCMIRM